MGRGTQPKKGGMYAIWNENHTCATQTLEIGAGVPWLIPMLVPSVTLCTNVSINELIIIFILKKLHHV